MVSHKFGIYKLDSIFLTVHEDMIIDHLIRKIEDLYSVKVALQFYSKTLSDTRALFDAIQENFPRIEPSIGAKEKNC